MALLSRRRAQAVVELIAGTLILVSGLMFFIDGVAVVVTQQKNAAAAQTAARSAANQADSDMARKAANDVIRGLVADSGNQSLSIQSFEYDEQSKSVRVETRIQAQLPIPLGSLSHVSLASSDSQPIVAFSSL